MEAILTFTQQLYRAAQDASADDFHDVALAHLKQQVRFCAALWLVGRVTGREVEVHRLHAYRISPAGCEPVVCRVRQQPESLALAAAAPHRVHILQPAVPSVPVVHHELLIAAAAADAAACGQWLSLQRSQGDTPFDATDRETLRLLMPHLTEARAVNRALRLLRASNEARLEPRPHRAVTLTDGTVLHCGAHMREAMDATWPYWSGLCLPPELLAAVRSCGELTLPGRGERIVAHRFSDALVLCLKRVSLRERLTRRECEMVHMLTAGSDYTEIARRYALAPATVRAIVRQTYRKLGINSRTQLARLVRREERE